MTKQNTELRESVSNFLRRNFPQIQMHGGSSAITAIDNETGYVEIQLGGACSGCGISPMTTEAIKRRLCNEIEGIETVTVKTGMNDMDVNGTQAPDKSSMSDSIDVPF